MTSLHTGSCRCGAVRFEAQAEPFHISYCHCVDCRKASGAPLSAFVGFKSETSAFAGAKAEFVNGAITRCFCPVCGTPLAYLDDRLPDDIYLTLGALDEQERYVPTLHAWVDQKLPYFHIGDGLPQLERTSVPRPDGANE
jgi:hypothetical protein